MARALKEPMPERWLLAVALDRAAKKRGWFIRFRSVRDDEVIVVYRKGIGPEPGGDHEDSA